MNIENIENIEQALYDSYVINYGFGFELKDGTVRVYEKKPNSGKGGLSKPVDKAYLDVLTVSSFPSISIVPKMYSKIEALTRAKTLLDRYKVTKLRDVVSLVLLKME